MKYIIWDWNGTLFDDVEVCIESINQVLQRHGVARLTSRAEYRQKFCFPVERYYQNLGFDFSQTPFSQLAAEFMEIYQPASLSCRLAEGVPALLAHAKQQGFRQVVLSASKLENLQAQLQFHPISGYFDEVLGINDILAKTKVQLARQWLARQKPTPRRLLIVGDTLHDAEVAGELGGECSLYANGHQDVSEFGGRVIAGLSEVFQ
jgi:phosphoglycolate phosphatase